MPGYHRPVSEHLEHWGSLDPSAASHVLCLAGKPERDRKAPGYREFIHAIAVGNRWLEFPIEDRSIPEDPQRFALLLEQLAGILRSPDGLLVIHCAAGVGRTGMVGVALLIHMGLPAHDALILIENAGSFPDTRAQVDFALSFGR